MTLSECGYIIDPPPSLICVIIFPPQHVPLRHGVTADCCDPHDFLTALVVTLAGAATSLYLSALDFKKPATVSAACEVKEGGGRWYRNQRRVGPVGLRGEGSAIDS